MKVISRSNLALCRSSRFFFLVYAPVGTTEFMREASDQASLQDQDEAQQLEINQLKAQIETEKSWGVRAYQKLRI